MVKPFVTVGIAGGSGSGKTTLARRLLHELGGATNVNYILHDSYYKDQSDKSPEERALTNFDHPDSLETELLVRHLQELQAGRTVRVPVYDFVTHTRRPETVEVAPARVVLVDGILLLAHPDLRRLLDVRVFVDAAADVRFIRRLQRDVAERGRTVDSVVRQYHATVRPMHLAHVEPTKELADLVVHSTTHSMTVAVELLANHVKLKAGIPLEAVGSAGDGAGAAAAVPGVSYDPATDSFHE